MFVKAKNVDSIYNLDLCENIDVHIRSIRVAFPKSYPLVIATYDTEKDAEAKFTLLTEALRSGLRFYSLD